MTFRARADIGDCLEVLLSRIYHRIVRPGDVVIDGGANAGLHAIPLARLVGPTGRLYAYEPQPKPFSKLSRELGRSGWSTLALFCLGRRSLAELKRTFLGSAECTLRQVAIGSRADRVSFFTHAADSGLSSARRMSDSEDWSETTVDMVRLDDERIPARVSFIKLDLEGGEHDALAGARALIARDRPVIAFENGFERPAERFGYHLAAFFSFFADLGYEVHDFLGVHATAPETFSSERLLWELVAIPKESPLRTVVLAEIASFNARHTELPQAANWTAVVRRVQSPMLLLT